MPKDFVVSITDEEEKALLTDMISVQDWLDNAIHEKARRCIDEICRQALEDKTHTILTIEEKRTLRDYLDEHNIVISSVKELPQAVKNQIVKYARVPSAAEQETGG